MGDVRELDRRRFLYGSAVAAGARPPRSMYVHRCRGGRWPRRAGRGCSSTGREGLDDATTAGALAAASRHPRWRSRSKAGQASPGEGTSAGGPTSSRTAGWSRASTAANCRWSSTPPRSAAIKEYIYGHSILRFLNDGLDVGPGLVESWESNDDATEWTFHFRKGLKWSDGQPVDDRRHHVLVGGPGPQRRAPGGRRRTTCARAGTRSRSSARPTTSPSS